MADTELPMGEGPLDGPDDEMAEPVADDETAELDPQFAADAAEAFPDLDDKGLYALQRAVQGLMVR
jgi:hypothetical protein